MLQTELDDYCDKHSGRASDLGGIVNLCRWPTTVQFIKLLASTLSSYIDHTFRRSIGYAEAKFSKSGVLEYNSRVKSVASLPALGPWAPPAERGPSLESIYRVSFTVDLCEGNKIISFRKFISPQLVGGPSKGKKSKIQGPWARPQPAHWLRRPWVKYPYFWRYLNFLLTRYTIVEKSSHAKTSSIRWAI